MTPREDEDCLCHISNAATAFVVVKKSFDLVNSLRFIHFDYFDWHTILSNTTSPSAVDETDDVERTKGNKWLGWHEASPQQLHLQKSTFTLAREKILDMFNQSPPVSLHVSHIFIKISFTFRNDICETYLKSNKPIQLNLAICHIN